MTNQERCFIETITFTNYRCFPEIAVRFHDRLTVVVAPNGGGKTAILDGVAVALRLFVDTMEETPGFGGFHANDIRLMRTPADKLEPVTPVRLEATGVLLGESLTWARERPSKKSSRTSIGEAQAVRQLAIRLVKANQAWAQRHIPTPPLFPLVASYGTGRLWSTGTVLEGRPPTFAPNARARGYVDCLASAANYRLFTDWFRRFSYEAQQELLSGQPSPHRPQQPLSAVRMAVATALAPSGWHSLAWDFAEDIMVAEHITEGRRPVTMLSDGIRTMISLVADIAHRAARLNPHLGENAASQTPGIVLIDEVDMHLHPAWQQVVLDALQKAFPALQLIVSTHSPQVLTTLRKENIRILACDEAGQWTAREPGMSPLAHESGDALALIMGTHPRPQSASILADLHAYEQLARAGRADSPEAQRMKERLDTAGFEFSPADQALFAFLTRKAKSAKVNT